MPLFCRLIAQKLKGGALDPRLGLRRDPTPVSGLRSDWPPLA
ncbi:hypothetical protein [Thermostichus sp. MS-CIW-25]